MTVPPICDHEAVENGLAILDQAIGSDWTSRVDRYRLDMGDPRDDLLTQVFGSHEEALGLIGITEDEAQHLGLLCPDSNNWGPRESLDLTVEIQVGIEDRTVQHYFS